MDLSSKIQNPLIIYIFSDFRGTFKIHKVQERTGKNGLLDKSRNIYIRMDLSSKIQNLFNPSKQTVIYLLYKAFLCLVLHSIFPFLQYYILYFVFP